ncbi:ADP-ribosylglycohydrolase family protein [Microbispora sp. GKU 823]|uniref:ADP-ribosylglycohydrolase family protein n=1 Tax=Microbispora sp. GKU 823 TaxID=1652100 RepID=UPI002117459E|nr:ADP-ribosylglycohydrolase family protein [Microbispora sp. GKU 823]
MRGAFAGLAAGDAAGWPAARHRSTLLAGWSRRLHRELDAFAEEHQVTTLPVPFALNQPVAALAVGPSDDAEWLAWTALTIREDRAEAFGRLAGRDDLRARISVWAALDNLAAGKRPPASGHDNPHHFDDAAAVRAVAFGAAGLDPREDACVTNAEDGVLGAVAMARAVRRWWTARRWPTRWRRRSARCPPARPSGTRRARRSRRRGRQDLPSPPSRPWTPPCSTTSTATAWPPRRRCRSRWPSRTPPSPPPQGRPVRRSPVRRSSVRRPSARASPRRPASRRSPTPRPRSTGALLGCAAGHDALPAAWRERVRTLAGCCLPELAGTDLLDIAGRLA